MKKQQLLKTILTMGFTFASLEDDSYCDPYRGCDR